MPPAGVPPVAVADVWVPVCPAAGVVAGAASVVEPVAPDPSADGVPVWVALPVEPAAPEGSPLDAAGVPDALLDGAVP